MKKFAVVMASLLALVACSKKPIEEPVVQNPSTVIALCGNYWLVNINGQVHLDFGNGNVHPVDPNSTVEQLCKGT